MFIKECYWMWGRRTVDGWVMWLFNSGCKISIDIGLLMDYFIGSFHHCITQVPTQLKIGSTTSDNPNC